MNLTQEITNRKLNFKPQIEISNKIIKIKDIGISINISDNFSIDKKDTFGKFKNEYIFPENSELNKKDRESFINAIFKPLFILNKNGNNRPIIVCYLYNLIALKGKNNLNIRSINKLELMWSSYLLKSKNSRRLNAKRISINDLNGALSEPFRFEYKTKNGLELISNLRILTIKIKSYILTFYIVDDDNNQIKQTELENFIKGIKINTPPYNNNFTES